MAIPNVTPYSGQKPVPGQDQPTFNQNMSDELDYFNALPAELNQAIDAINQTATDVDNAKIAAETAETAAAASATSAEQAAASLGYKGEWTQEANVELGGIYGYQGSEWRSLTGVSGVAPSASDTVNWRGFDDYGALPSGRVLKHRRGNTAEISNFTPAIGELIMNTDTNELILGDGETQGGHLISPKIVNTLTALKNRKYRLGDVVRTLGYASIGDGGDGVYQVVAAGTGSDDGGLFVDLPGSSLQAKLIVSNGVINISQYGVDRTTGDAALAINAINGHGFGCLVSGTYNFSTEIQIDVSKGALVGSDVAQLILDDSVAQGTNVFSIFSSADYANRPMTNLQSQVSGIAFNLNGNGTVTLGGAAYPESSEIQFENGAFVAPYKVVIDENGWRSRFVRWPIVRGTGQVIEFAAESNAGEVMEFIHGWFVDQGADWTLNEGQWVFRGCSLPAGAPAGQDSVMALSGNATVSFSDGNIEYQPNQQFVGFTVTGSSRMSIRGSSVTISPTHVFDRPVFVVNDDGVLSLTDCALPLFGAYEYEQNAATRQLIGGNSDKILSRGCYPKAGFTVANWENGAIVSPYIQMLSNNSFQLNSIANWTSTPYGTQSGSTTITVDNDVPNTLMYNTAVAITTPADGGLALTQNIPVNDVCRYFQFGFWCKSPTGSMIAAIKFLRSDAGEISSFSYAIPNNADYKWYALIENLPPETASVTVEFNAQQANASNHHLHNVVFGLI